MGSPLRHMLVEHERAASVQPSQQGSPSKYELAMVRQSAVFFEYRFGVIGQSPHVWGPGLRWRNANQVAHDETDTDRHSITTWTRDKLNQCPLNEPH